MWHVSYLKLPLRRGFKWAQSGFIRIQQPHMTICVCALTAILQSNSSYCLAKGVQGLEALPRSYWWVLCWVSRTQWRLRFGKGWSATLTEEPWYWESTHSLPCVQHLVTVNEDSNITVEGEIHQVCVCVCVCVWERRKRAKKIKWQVPAIRECSVVWLMILPQQQLLYSTPTTW